MRIGYTRMSALRNFCRWPRNSGQPCRCFSLSCTASSEHKLTLKGRKRKASSYQWLERQLADPYVKWAKVDQYRCRSAFKLIEMDDKLKILSPGIHVVDCGAAPGSWSQVLVKRLNATGADPNLPKGSVISIDKSDFMAIDGAISLSGHDFTAEETQKMAKDLLAANGGANGVLSDMAPAASGVKNLDHDVITNLVYIALRFSLQVSKPGGFFLAKLWDGSQTTAIQADAGKFYDQTKIIKPPASRADSAEMFLFAKGFKGLKK